MTQPYDEDAPLGQGVGQGVGEAPVDEGIDVLPISDPDRAGSVDDTRYVDDAVAAVVTRTPSSRRRVRKRGPLGCILILVVVFLLAVGIALLGVKGIDWAKDKFGTPEDYTGPGSGAVSVVVEPGDTSTDIGRTLQKSDVVGSVEAFTGAASARSDDAARIQPGTYELKQKMKATDALSLLIDPKNRVANRITVPEGLRVVDTVAILAKKTDFTKNQFTKALTKTDKIGLPSYADGNAEGYLFPATYEFAPKATPVEMLATMISRWRKAADDAGLEESASDLGYTPQEVMTVASLVEAEGRGDDMPKIARVIYNRLENPGKSGTIGRLEIDATVNYALGRNLGVAISSKDLDVDSPYNTRRRAGLPPGPIEAPGDQAIRAALEPTKGDWYYYVTVNLKTGETKFAKTYDEFLRYKAEFRQYCTTSKAC